MSLIDRLREFKISADPSHPVHPQICDDAADEIWRLMQEIETANKELKRTRGIIHEAYRVVAAHVMEEGKTP